MKNFMLERKHSLLLCLMLIAFFGLGCQLFSLLRQSPAPSRLTDSSNSSDSNSTAPPAAEKNYKAMEDKAQELGKTPTIVKLNPKAAIKGKVAVVAKKYEFSDEFQIEGFNAYKTDFASASELERFALTKESMATAPEEIETLVHIKCNQGKVIGRYVSPAGDQSVPAYSMVCKVSIIDYRAKTVVAQKTLENKTLEKSARVDDDDTKYVNLAPWSEIEKYLKSFPVA